MRTHGGASALAVLSVLSIAIAQDDIDCPYTPNWQPCETDVGQTAIDPDEIDCASMNVPEDWTDESGSGGEITLRLVRRRADVADVDAAPAIMVNPGGPGGSGIDSVLESEDLWKVAGKSFSIIGYDPRGVGLNIEYDCIPPGTREGDPDTLGNDFSDPNYFANAFTTYSGRAEFCDANWGGSAPIPEQRTGRLISTTQTARDIKAISEVVGDGKLRYWGFSYGTLLGATLAKLFPDEIEGMIIDGNINPNDYYNSNISPSEEVSDVDVAIENYFDKCAEREVGSEFGQCGWDTPDGQERTGENLLAKFAAWVGDDPTATDRGRDSSLPAAQQLDVDQSYTVRSTVYRTLKRSDLFSRMANVLEYWYEDEDRIPQDGAPDLEKYSPSDLPLPSNMEKRQNADSFNPYDASSSDPALTGITCVDSRFHPAGLSAGTYKSIYDEYNGRTIYAGDVSINGVYDCIYARDGLAMLKLSRPWKTEPKEEFTGPSPFLPGSVQTSPGRVLVIQTPYDPVTPSRSGKAAADALNGYLVTTNGFGHCSDDDRSTALRAAVGQYWQNNALPPQSSYAVDRPNPFDEPIDYEDETIDFDGGLEEGDMSNEGDEEVVVDQKNRKRGVLKTFASHIHQRRPLPDWSFLFKKSNVHIIKRQNQFPVDTTPPEAIGPNQVLASQPNCSDATTSTTSRIGSTTMTSMMTTTSGSGIVSATTTNTEGVMSTTSCPYSPWATKAYYEPWKNQADCAPFTMADGKVYAVPTNTIYIDYVDDVCETGRYQKTITVTAQCNKGCYDKPTGVPQGYTTTTVYCSACAHPSNVPVTIKSGETWHVKPAAPTAAPAKPGHGAAPPPGQSVADEQWADSPASDAPAKPAGEQGGQWPDAPVAAASGEQGGQWPDAPVAAASGKPAAVGSQWSDAPVAAATPTKPGNVGAGDEWSDGKVGDYEGAAVANVVGASAFAVAAIAGLLVL